MSGAHAITDAIKVACLGAGYFARFHYDGWSRIDGAQLVGACDRNLHKAEATGAPAFTDLEEMLSLAKPDLLDIITPPPSHLAAIRAGLAAGVRAIICQKPFCTSLNEAREATALAEEAGVPLLIHENFRFQPWYRVMRAAMERGEIGHVHQVTFRLRTGDGQGPRAYLERQPYFQTMPRLLIHETGVHWIDTFRYLMGEPEAVYADLRRMNPVIAGEDAGYFILDYKEGVRALFDGNRLLDHASENHRLTFGEAMIEGTGGTLLLNGAGEVALRRFGEAASHVLLPAQQWPGFAGDCVKALQQHVIDGLNGVAPLENEARDYLKVITVEEALYASHESGRKIRELAFD